MNGNRIRAAASRGRRAAVLLLPLVLAASVAVPRTGRAEPAESAASREYQVKAAFLFNFVQFVEWPSAAFVSPSAPISIGILGNDPFGPTLDEVVRGEAVGSHPLAIRRARDVGELDACHVLFVCRSESARIDQILSRLEGRSVLVVGDADGFAARGGMIGFILEGSRVRFEVNPHAARRAGLKIGSQLLRLARIVGGTPGKESR